MDEFQLRVILVSMEESLQEIEQETFSLQKRIDELRALLNKPA
jgi:hypothetical protein